MIRFRKILIPLIILFVSHKAESQDLNIQKSENDQKIEAANKQKVAPVELPFIKAKNAEPVFLDNKVKSIHEKIQENKIIDTLKNDVLLLNNDHCAFEVDILNKKISAINPSLNLAAESVQAIEQCPLWLKDQLKLKLILLSKSKKDKDFASLILQAPENLKDEVAFTVANMSYQTLNDSRFASDKEMILRNAEFIYKVADSLQYVKLVEHGSYASRDYYTTTKYRIYDSQKKDTIWSEIPKEHYYWYIVHPKMDQEGVYVKDNANDAAGQRTYNYSWREFLWLNPDPTHNYMPVNITTNKGTVKDIPRFGELMQKPKVLWDRQETYLVFNRPLDESNSALDLLGNWASRALPVNVTLPRAFQPNQIIMKHNGMCNEDAFLVAGACRTALIPIIYLGSLAEDHVYGAVWDEDWHHFEFFRGGLEPTGNQFYGITNMLPGGSYGWKTSITEGFRPDGFPINFAKYYAKTSDYNITVTDSLGNPIEGVMLNVYGPSLSGRAYTNSEGKTSIAAGEGKSYLIQAYHPVYGWSPSDSTAFRLVNGTSVSGQTFNVTVPFLRLKRPTKEPERLKLPQTCGYGVKVDFKTHEIISSENPHDGQKSKFLKWNDTEKGNVTFFICDSLNYSKFKKNQAYKAYEFTGRTLGGSVCYGLPDDGKWYIVFDNSAPISIYEKLTAEISLLQGEIINAAPEKIEAEKPMVFPNPFSWHCKIEAPESAEVDLLDIDGSVIESLNPPFIWKPNGNISYGVYFAKIKTKDGIKLEKIIYEK